MLKVLNQPDFIKQNEKSSSSASVGLKCRSIWLCRQVLSILDFFSLPNPSSPSQLFHILFSKAIRLSPLFSLTPHYAVYRNLIVWALSDDQRIGCRINREEGQSEATKPHRSISGGWVQSAGDSSNTNLSSPWCWWTLVWDRSPIW